MRRTYESWTAGVTARDEMTAVTEPADYLSQTYNGSSMEVVAWTSPRLRWARVALCESYAGDSINVIFYPKVEFAAPILGIDIACGPEGLRFAGFDLWAGTGFGDILDAVGEAPGIAEHRLPIEGRFERILTPQAVALGPQTALKDVLEAGWAFIDGYLAMLSQAGPSDPRAQAEAQRVTCETLATRPGAREFLVRLFGARWSDDFMEQIYFPVPEPVAGDMGEHSSQAVG